MIDGIVDTSQIPPKYLRVLFNNLLIMRFNVPSWDFSGDVYMELSDATLNALGSPKYAACTFDRHKQVVRAAACNKSDEGAQSTRNRIKIGGETFIRLPQSPNHTAALALTVGWDAELCYYVSGAFRLAYGAVDFDLGQPWQRFGVGRYAPYNRQREFINSDEEADINECNLLGHLRRKRIRGKDLLRH